MIPDEELEYAPRQPIALFNYRCHLNCLWWSREYGLRFAWTLMEHRTGDQVMVHAVCLDAEGRVIDPTLGAWGPVYYRAKLIEGDTPTSPQSADRILEELKKRYEPKPKPRESINWVAVAFVVGVGMLIGTVAKSVVTWWCG